ncbi:IS1182 family transposase [Thalassobacillus devorans]|uniref:IS1182 family transposase n=1 Tax=Thalassobacillus devorans TaxID=279813 RepID=UPI0007809781|nr:IS1182 family transposase [Thalassobacillus devorans]
MSNSSATFIDYNMGQLVLPMDFSDLIPEDHVVRVIHSMVEQVNDDLFFSQYQGGGRSSYHPKMMTKVILYAYTQKIYSCREIAKALREHLPMMWLAGQQTPDFRTINRFRSERMKAIIEPLFTELIKLLIDQEYISMDNYFLDGTKIEANANKYTFVWKKSVQRYEEKLQEKLNQTFADIEDAIEMDEKILTDEGSPAKRVTSEQLEKVVEQVEAQVEQAEKAVEEENDKEKKKEKKEVFRAKRRIYKTLSQDYLPRLKKYETQLATFGDRNSFSKTDTDATFMRMKEDHMKNGQLKPGYNVQAGTENQFIIGYSIHQRPTDTRCFEPHIQKLQATDLPFPNTIVADGGYGGETNYKYAKKEGFDTLIPYNTMRKEQSRSFKKDPSQVMNWEYKEEGDYYICPNGRKVPFQFHSHRTDRYGYTRAFKVYECEACTGCPIKEKCTKAKGNRRVYYNPAYEQLKKEARESLWCDEGAQIYAKRKVEVESVFGHIKGNRSFRRFSLRGIDKVNIEFGLVAMAHNFLKQAELIRLFRGGNKLTMKKPRRKTISSWFFHFKEDFWDSLFIYCLGNYKIFFFG